MSETKIITNIPDLPEDETVTIKKLGFGGLNKLRSRSTINNINENGSNDSKLDLGEYMKWMLIYGIQTSKFFAVCKNEEDRCKQIDNDIITAKTGDYIFREIQKFNNFTGIEELKKN